MILVLGGAYSGKSRMVIEMAAAAGAGLSSGAKLGFLEPVPLEVLPEPVRQRAESQRAQRQELLPGVVELPAPFDAGELVERCTAQHLKGLVIDGLNLWLGHEVTQKHAANPGAMLERHLRRESQHLIAALLKLRDSGVRLIVSSAIVNEGLPPEHDSGRLMRETVSLVNTELAGAAALVCVMEAGCARALKVPSDWLPAPTMAGHDNAALWPAFMLGATAAGRLWPTPARSR